ncbi:hypothetical protein B0T22DRAFT_484143 [Podospora appendiculata]|uniref:Uncharacterized protein n=1 Tax=Podospora appendiculata TaxID=314037 RepID=A0AAE0X0B8_9PEZI|nr:hypothetical protein B0T22DRAFT_484143 [Podospora appendiculata]
MHKMINLQWTEVISSLLTGTKSRFSAAAGSDSKTPAIGEVQVYRKMVRYQYQYGTVAFLCCAIWLLWALICLFMFIVPQSRAKMSLSALSAMINNLPVGRAFDGKMVMDLSKWPYTLQDTGTTNNEGDHVTEGETLIESDEQGKESSSKVDHVTEGEILIGRDEQGKERLSEAFN